MRISFLALCDRFVKRNWAMRLEHYIKIRVDR
jgi:hypothetical protein